MSKPTSVLIIYNPKSTGQSKQNATEFQKALRKAGVSAHLQATDHKGHGEELAREFADTNPRGMVVSSSGDGGYHEVINGVVGATSSMVICGVLPSGNANDHYNFAHRGDTVKRIASGDAERIDLIKVKTPSWTRYAHSYVGLGMTSQIGKELAKYDLNPFVEALLVLKHIFVIRKVKIRVWGRKRSYDNLVFSNSGRMSKYLTLSNEASLTDGRFEITRVKSSSPFGLVRHLLHASTKRIDTAPQAKRYACKALRNMHIQLDGEIYTVKSGDRIVITCERRLLRTIV